MEFVYGLNTKATEVVHEFILRMTRVSTVSLDPEFVVGFADLIEKCGAETHGEVVELVTRSSEVMLSIHRANCCSNLHAAKPATCKML